MEFFRAMEANMKMNFKQGISHTPAGKMGLAVGAGTPQASTKGAADGRAVPEWVDVKALAAPAREVRTISTVDDLVLLRSQRLDADDRVLAGGRKDSSTAFFDLDAPPAAIKGASEAWAEQETASGDRKQRFNSSSTVFVDSTMAAPDQDATIECVCAVIRAHMLEAAKDGGLKVPEHPKATVFHNFDYTPGTDKVPPLAELVTFFRELFTKSQMEMECIIMSLIYMERLTRVTEGRVQVGAHNWKSLLVGSMIMASKVWDDLSMWNADFSQVCPEFNLQRINELELALLEFLHYSVKVTASDYAKYYFHLRSYSCRLGLTHDLKSLQPLDMDNAHKLSVLSANYEAGAVQAEKLKRRAQSMPEVKPTKGGVRARRAKGKDSAKGSAKGSIAEVGKTVTIEQLIGTKHKKAGETDEGFTATAP